MKKTLLISSLLLSTISMSQTAIINPVQDNSIFSEGTNSNGLGKLYSGTTNSGNFRRALLEFDIAAAVPSGATITGVSLDLTVDQFGGSSANEVYTIYPLITDWGEGTSSGGGAGAAAVSPDATWIDAMFGTSTWTASGGDFGPASATQTLTASNGTFTWNAATMVTDVQNWLDTPGSNFGWILIGDETANQTSRRFGSKDQGSAPVLNVTYTVACTTPPNAVCQNIMAYLDGTGSVTILDSDLDNGSTLVCGTTLSFSAAQTTFVCSDIATGPSPTSLVISAVYDGPLSGGTPKGIELYVINDIADLSLYGIGSANNGGGTDGVEFTFPAVSATAGDYIYIASESPQFTAWFGFAPDYTSGSMSINGDDAIELFENSVLIDVFGDQNVSGSGQPWDYLDGWAHRVSSTGPGGSTFTLADWTFSGANALDTETTNGTAATPVPVGTYTTPSTQSGVSVILTVSDDLTNSSTCSSIVTVLDTLPPAISCVGTFALALDGTGNGTLTTGDLDAGTTEGCGAAILSLSQTAFTCADIGTVPVTLYATDSYGNIDSCTVSVNVTGSAAVTIDNIVTVDPTCFGTCDGSIIITATNGTNFSVDNGATFQTGNSFNSLCAGNYDILVNNGAGCEVSSSVALNEPSQVLMTVENDTVCIGDTGTLELVGSGGTPPYSYDLDGTVQASGIFAGLAIGGPYAATVVDANGCSSITENKFVVEAPAIDTTLTELPYSFTSNQTGATYQWINCDNMTIIAGVTGPTYDLLIEPLIGPEVAVVITDAFGCSDTSKCVSTQFQSLESLNGNEVSVYPNPADEVVNVRVSGNTSNLTVSVLDLNGRILGKSNFSGNLNTIDVSGLENGVYLIELVSSGSAVTQRIVVQH